MLLVASCIKDVHSSVNNQDGNHVLSPYLEVKDVINQEQHILEGL